MKRKFKITLEYDGTRYQGWQRQNNGPTIQEALEEALFRMLKARFIVSGSGRTDSGVHALGQTAHFSADTNLAPGVFVKALNSLMAEDIAVLRCEEVPLDFHARKSATGKIYRYHILNRPVREPLGRLYAWHLKYPLDLPAMEAAAGKLVGTRDFASVQAAGSPRSSTVRTVSAAFWEKDGDRLTFTIQADGFLRFMVRNIVGTLVEVGLGRLKPDDIPKILEARDRSLAGATAPPHGLFLVEVNYG